MTTPPPIQTPVGEGLFESVRVADGRVFALDRHLGRLQRSAAALGMPAPSDAEVRRAVAEAVAAQAGLELGRLRLTWTWTDAGDCELGLTLDAIAARREPEAVVTLDRPVDGRHVLAGHKTTAYLDHVLALAAARAAGAGEGIRATVAGDLCEATAANVFLVLDGRLCTPTLASGCLPGVTRGLVVAWCDVEEVDVPLTEGAAAASEVFLTSATRVVQPVRRWDDRVLPAPGPATRDVLARWREREPALWTAPNVSPAT